jgi:hypothetical protein
MLAFCGPAFSDDLTTKSQHIATDKLKHVFYK